MTNVGTISGLCGPGKTGEEQKTVNHPYQVVKCRSVEAVSSGGELSYKKEEPHAQMSQSEKDQLNTFEEETEIIERE